MHVYILVHYICTYSYVSCLNVYRSSWLPFCTLPWQLNTVRQPGLKQEKHVYSHRTKSLKTRFSKNFTGKKTPMWHARTYCTVHLYFVGLYTNCFKVTNWWISYCNMKVLAERKINWSILHNFHSGKKWTYLHSRIIGKLFQFLQKQYCWRGPQSPV